MAQPDRTLRQRLRAAVRDAGDLAWRARRRLLLAAPLMLVNRLASLVLPGTTKYFIDDVLTQGRHDLIGRLVLIAAAASILTGITEFALSQLLGVAAQKSITDLRRQVQEHVQRLPVRYFDATTTGAVVSRVLNDAEGLRNLVGSGLILLVGGMLSATIAVGILFYLSPLLASFILGSMLLFAAVIFWALQKSRPIFKARNEEYSRITGRLTETLSGIRVVKAYRGERRESLLFAEGAHRLLRHVLGTMRLSAVVGAVISLLIGLVTITVLMVGSREVAAGNLTVGELVTFLVYLSFVIGPVAQMVGIATQLSEAFAGLERIRETLNQETEDAADETKAPIDSIRGDVEFQDVTFEYTPGVPVLRDISFVVPAGRSIALVGPSGSGKSTLVSLVASFHQPTRGRITVDGQDLTALRLRDYRRHIGIVPQDSFLFADTIRANIAVGRPKATREEIERAAHIAHVDEFAEKFKDGYETIVGERGVRLSGGQKQRVAIARAILADPRILILDEATSSLDSESEALIQDGLKALMRGRTTFVIAHRLSTIRTADQIMLLEGGAIVERGTHDELMALGGRYRALYERQYGIAMNRFVNAGEELEDVAAR